MGEIGLELAPLGASKAQATRAWREKLSEFRGPADLPALLDAMKSALQLPPLTVEFEKVTVSRQVPIVDPGIQTVASKVVSLVSCAGCRRPKREFRLVSEASGVLRAGTMTLILAPPGHGKSTLLKTLAGAEAPSSGSVRYNGQTREEARAAGFNVEKAVVYLDQVDCHLSLLTVRETFLYAVEHAMAHSDDPNLQQAHPRLADAMIRVLGLEECANTIVGNALIRGVSGGQRKRVSIGEALLKNPRAVFLDEITNGLDAATALDIMVALKHWATITGGVVVCALLQPTPEIYELFDHLLLLREGTIVYNGPREEVVPYFEQRGIVCPDDVDIADFLVDVLAAPQLVYARQTMADQGPHHNNPMGAEGKVGTSAIPTLCTACNLLLSAFVLKSRNCYLLDSIALRCSSPLETFRQEALESHIPGVVVFHYDTPSRNSAKVVPVVNSPVLGLTRVPLTTAELEASYRQSYYYKQVELALHERRERGTPLSGFARLQYGVHARHSFWHSALVNLRRQAVVTARNTGLTVPRLAASVFFGLLLGSMFWKLGTTPDVLSMRVSLTLMTCIFVVFTNFLELPAAVESRNVVKKQIGYGFYGELSYILAVVLMELPMIILETAILGSMVYWMAGFANEVGRFFAFLGFVFVLHCSMSVFFRFVALANSRVEAAQVQSGAVVAVLLTFGGVVIPRGDIPPWFIWIFWISPVSWAVRAVSINEFKADRYDAPLSPEMPIRTGDVYMDSYDFFGDSEFHWGGALFLLGFFLLFVAGDVLSLKFSKLELSRGTKRTDEDVESNPIVGGMSIVQIRRLDSPARDLPFTPVTLAFKNVGFTISIRKDGRTFKRQLLHGITGYAKPGTLTALMGATGAGKTTLMDVLAGRKTQGVITGEILVNGKPKEARSFARLAGYVEQTDSHFPTATVHETLLFAADLRLPSTVSEARKEAFVEEVMEILELSDIQNRLISSLSPGQLKRVTIGVELVANPSVLFLDEPTTGLDSRAALTVIRVIRRIASTGRSVICTIHQPSAEVFYMFDRLLLLQSGGYQVYFGPLGRRGAEIVKYLESCFDDVPRKPPRMNPASWMLDVIGAGIGSTGNASDPFSPSEDGAPSRFVKAYEQSVLKQQNDAEWRVATKPDNSAAGASFSSGYAASYLKQCAVVATRTFQNYWRNTAYNFTRLFLLLLLGLMVGLLYLDLEVVDEAGVVSKLAVFLVATGFGGLINSAPALPALLDLRPTYYRERFSQMYASFVYTTSVMVAEIPFILVSCIMVFTPPYLMVPMRSGFVAYCKLLLPLFLSSLCLNSLSVLLTAVMPDAMSGITVLGSVVFLFFLFGGLFQPGPLVPKGWKWIYDISLVQFALGASAAVEFECTEADASACPTITRFSGEQMAIHDYVDQIYGFKLGSDGYTDYIIYVIIWLAVLQVLVALSYRFVIRMKR